MLVYVCAQNILAGSTDVIYLRLVILSVKQAGYIY